LFVKHAQNAVLQDKNTPAETPVGNTKPADGTYEITAETDSSMFKITKCTLNVEGGKMTANITLSGTGYGKIIVGTKENAPNVSAEKIAEFTLNDGGTHDFVIPVSELEKELPYAAWSIKKETWYDQKVTFKAPASTSAETHSKTETPDNSAQTANVTLTGGSGKAKITSPANIKKVDGKDIATLVWSSKNYEYMIIDGVKYLPTTTEPGSTFEVPVKLGEEMTIIGCTSAMGSPKEIEYKLTLE
jgi:hypothetical protein